MPDSEDKAVRDELHHLYAGRRAADSTLAVLKSEFHHFRQQYHRDEIKRDKATEEIFRKLDNLNSQIYFSRGVAYVAAALLTAAGGLVALIAPKLADKWFGA